MQIHVQGKQLFDGQTVTLDHSVQKFEVVVRSMSSVAATRLKDIIQKQLEVVSIKEIERVDYVW